MGRELKWQKKSLRKLSGKRRNIKLAHPSNNSTIPAILSPSVLTDLSPINKPDMDIRLLPVDLLIRHEWFLVEGLKSVSFIEEDKKSHGNNWVRWKDAPMMGAMVYDSKGKEEIIVIDGSTRLARAVAISAVAKLLYPDKYPPVFPVQVVDFYHPDLLLGIWEDHHPEKMQLTKDQVLSMVRRNKLVKAKQTKFGVRIGKKVFSIAETQPELIIDMEYLLGFKPELDAVWSLLLM